MRPRGVSLPSKSPDVITYIYSAEWLLEIEAIAVV